ncbi:helix-turn-helix domain-containing protein [Turicibacter sanguinis]|uniref:helix-turn-helix domain-containing protein n=1 Tax=Turicibacter sanguinis TaxID=154288 RepID=UPI0021D4F627|nr:helix-turn-helix transcriptional regulator [Turicibacter sanguinis]MCU7192404.1 helix-turn-helix domain-containing protein [Turicibacter sanguinis]
MANELGKRLKSLRQQRGLLQKQVATQLGITESGYGFYEQGKRTPDSEMLKKIAAIYDVSADYLLGIDKPLTQEHLTTINDAINTHLGEDISIMFKDINNWDEEKIKKLKTFIELIDEGKI